MSVRLVKPKHPKAIDGAKGTWLEPEELCYPSGGRHRRALALVAGTETLRVVRCGIPDTYFTIPADGGYVSVDDGAFTFHPKKAGVV